MHDGLRYHEGFLRCGAMHLVSLQTIAAFDRRMCLNPKARHSLTWWISNLAMELGETFFPPQLWMDLTDANLLG